MSIKTRLQEQALRKFGNDGFNVIAKLEENMRILEQHMVIVTKNQVEFELYLKEILKNIKNE